MQNVGSKIRAIRKNLGFSMEKFGTLFNPHASKGVVSNWENNYNLPNNNRLRKIAELGETTVEELLYGSYPEYVLQVIQAIMTSKNRTEKQNRIFKILNILSLQETEDSISNILSKIAEEARINNISLGDQDAFETLLLAQLSKFSSTEIDLLYSISASLQKVLQVIDILVEDSESISEDLSGDIQVFSDYIELDLERLNSIIKKYTD